jgi:hypothetical protein
MHSRGTHDSDDVQCVRSLRGARIRHFHDRRGLNLPIPDDELRSFLLGCSRWLLHLAGEGRERDQVEAARWREEILQGERYRDRRALPPFGRKVYSQNDEDGILGEILYRLGPGSRTFFEFGAGDGLESNTLCLLADGWKGLWVEPNAAMHGAICRSLGPALQDGRLTLSSDAITPESIDRVAETGGVHGDLDVLSIDIDGNDLWVWRAFQLARPRVVIIEYNATWTPPLDLAVPYAPGWAWDGSNYFGAAREALTRVGAELGYSLVACCLAGVNAFFVRSDLVSDSSFLPPYTAGVHYEPPRYFLKALPAGHRPGFGALVRP